MIGKGVLQRNFLWDSGRTIVKSILAVWPIHRLGRRFELDRRPDEVEASAVKLTIV